MENWSGNPRQARPAGEGAVRTGPAPVEMSETNEMTGGSHHPFRVENVPGGSRNVQIRGPGTQNQGDGVAPPPWRGVLVSVRTTSLFYRECRVWTMSREMPGGKIGTQGQDRSLHYRSAEPSRGSDNPYCRRQLYPIASIQNIAFNRERSDPRN